MSDGHGATAVQNFSVVAGNTRPTVNFTTPIDGRFSEFGDNIPFKVQVTDPEDGAIDCTQVNVTYALGHNEHAHPMAEATPDANCEGVLVPGRDAAHGPGAYVYHVIQATYTDKGGAGGTQPLLGEDGVVLHPRSTRRAPTRGARASACSSGSCSCPARATGSCSRASTWPTSTASTSRSPPAWPGVKFTVHADSPTGPVVATVENIPYTGSTSILQPPVQVVHVGCRDRPGRRARPVLRHRWPEDLQPEVFVRSLQFITAPETVTATVAPAEPNGANGWYTAPVTVTVDTGGAPLWTRQISLDGGATWTNTDADGRSHRRRRRHDGGPLPRGRQRRHGRRRRVADGQHRPHRTHDRGGAPARLPGGGRYLPRSREPVAERRRRRGRLRRARRRHRVPGQRRRLDAL